MEYLGTEIWYTGEMDVSKKITNFLKTSGLMNRVIKGSCARRETRLKIYNTIPQIEYGSEVLVQELYVEKRYLHRKKLGPKILLMKVL